MQSWGEFSYEELERAILDGHINELINWQERYAEVVNNNFAPLWAKAMTEAARTATNGKIILSDSDESIQAWIKLHGAELVTQLGEESKKAIANAI